MTEREVGAQKERRAIRKYVWDLCRWKVRPNEEFPLMGKLLDYIAAREASAAKRQGGSK